MTTAQAAPTVRETNGILEVEGEIRSPYINHDLEPARLRAGLSTRQLQRALETSYCGSTLYKSNLGRDRAARVAEIVASGELRRLAASEVYWDRIDAIEPAP